jgi:LAS superfamily LD-carboxypeptidase LdcB
MAISWSEMLGSKKLADLPKDHQSNLQILFDRINKVREKYGKSMTPSSVYRSLAEHLAIYAKKGITDQSKIPMKSKHLFGQAIDIADPDGKLKEWVKANEAWLLELGLWCEHYEDTIGWCHFQIVPYGSWKPGKSIWFKP